MKKLLILAAAGAGYVLGTKAGRERYEKIKQHSSKVWNSNPVQQGVHEAEGVARQAASAAGRHAADAASAAGSKVAAKVKGDDGSDGAPEPGPAPDVAAAGDPLGDAVDDDASVTKLQKPSRKSS